MKLLGLYLLLLLCSSRSGWLRVDRTCYKKSVPHAYSAESISSRTDSSLCSACFLTSSMFTSGENGQFALSIPEECGDSRITLYLKSNAEARSMVVCNDSSRRSSHVWYLLIA